VGVQICLGRGSVGRPERFATDRETMDLTLNVAIFESRKMTTMCNERGMLKQAHSENDFELDLVEESLDRRDQYSY
jgi:hypothetical protein